MSEKKVLIITYYWPPCGGAGVQRWLKFAKYLPLSGWTPIVYTPSNAEMPVIDNSLLREIPTGTTVIKRKIWEPYRLYKKFIGAGKGEKINTGFLTETKKPGVAEKISVWLRGNLFIPDARCFWIKPSIKYLSTYLSQNKIDAIISTGPPHSMHLIAMKLSGEFNIPWIADFRDPWTNIDYYKDLRLTAYADNKHKQLEYDVIKNASRVIVIGNTMQMEFKLILNREIDVISNGFDEEDIVGRPESSKAKFVISHIGTLVKSRNSEALWSAIAILIQSDISFASRLEIRLIGKVDLSVRESISENDLNEFVKYIEYLPHDEVTLQQLEASVLLLILNDTPNAKGILTGKLFEYLSARRPILCLGPKLGDAAAIINSTSSGVTIDFDDELAIKVAIENYFEAFKQGKLEVNSSNIDQYTRRSLTKKLVEVLDEVIK